MTATILLATVAIEPNRWGLVVPGGEPTIRASQWLTPAAEAGFDGIELWERHATDASDQELEALLSGAPPISIFSTYASWDEGTDERRDEAAGWVRRTGATGVKYNVGADPDRIDEYAERLSRWSESVPGGTRLICECHWGTIAENPETAARLLSRAGPADRFQALVHLGDEEDLLKAKFEHHGDRISHVHVNFLDGMSAPRLCDIRDRVESRVDLLSQLGFAGTWSIEFSHGLGTDRDEPAYLLETAAQDLSLLRELIG